MTEIKGADENEEKALISNAHFKTLMALLKLVKIERMCLQIISAVSRY